MLSVSTGTSAYQYQSMFTSLDKNGDGTVSQDEFSTGRPSDVTAEQSATLFGSLNTSGTGALTYDEYVAGSESAADSTSAKLSGEMMAKILDMLQQTQGTERPQPPSSSDMFADMDTDGDGSVTEAEFVAARPENVSEEQATDFFARLDSEGTGALSEEQFSAAMEANRPAGPPPGMMPPPAEETSETDSTSTSSDSAAETIQSLLDQLLSAIEAYKENSGSDLDTTETLLAA
ncbi:EF-hand domain-containing protein [Pararhizobium arenae]|uniref:EF-hand domain-containing protein n=1 Tax=Pararhizobium arenae TaxID=1856850 RepID=UPI0013012FF2|nr:EF-hand domain-containing protein [Pararhizobium arenae]